MLTTKRSELKSRAEYIIKNLNNSVIKDFGISIIDSFVEAGSGSLPQKSIESIALCFNPISMDTNQLSEMFKKINTPVIGYIKRNKFYIDLKGVLDSQIKKLINAIIEVYNCTK